MPDARVVIRPAAAIRTYMIVFACVWFGLLGAMTIGILVAEPWPAVLFPIGMLVFGGFIISSNLRMRVVAEGDELRVRNFVREERIPRASITRFVDHAPGGMPSRLGGVIAVLLDDGRLIDLRATGGGPFARGRRTDHRQRLDRWLTG
jgi:hypothetical protein